MEAWQPPCWCILATLVAVLAVADQPGLDCVAQSSKIWKVRMKLEPQELGLSYLTFLLIAGYQELAKQLHYHS